MINRTQHFQPRKEHIQRRIREHSGDEQEVGYYKRKLKALKREEMSFYRKDVTQPYDNNYRKYYPQQYADMEKAEQNQHLKIEEAKKTKDKLFKRYKTSVHSQEMRNALKLEEKLEHGK